MPTVYRGNTTTTVKNLGWLLKHASECQQISIAQIGDSDHAPAQMYARGVDAHGEGWEYTTSWGSYTLACQWVKRPSLAHVLIRYRHLGDAYRLRSRRF
jgi:hypothetical protein